MRLTHFTDYAFRTLIYLGLSDPQQVTISEISHAYKISHNNLVKVVHHLGRLGLVKTTRGRSGGLRLARSADQIIVGHLIRRTEEDLVLVECFANSSCIITNTCRMRGVLGEALEAFLSVLDRYSLADLLGGNEGSETAKLLGLSPLRVPAADPSWVI